MSSTNTKVCPYTHNAPLETKKSGGDNFGNISVTSTSTEEFTVSLPGEKGAGFVVTTPAFMRSLLLNVSPGTQLVKHVWPGRTEASVVRNYTQPSSFGPRADTCDLSMIGLYDDFCSPPTPHTMFSDTHWKRDCEIPIWKLYSGTDRKDQLRTIVYRMPIELSYKRTESGSLCNGPGCFSFQVLEWFRNFRKYSYFFAAIPNMRHNVWKVTCVRAPTFLDCSTLTTDGRNFWAAANTVGSDDQTRWETVAFEVQLSDSKTHDCPSCRKMIHYTVTLPQFPSKVFFHNHDNFQVIGPCAKDQLLPVGLNDRVEFEIVAYKAGILALEELLLVTSSGKRINLLEEKGRFDLRSDLPEPSESKLFSAAKSATPSGVSLSASQSVKLSFAVSTLSDVDTVDPIAIHMEVMRWPLNADTTLPSRSTQTPVELGDICVGTNRKCTLAPLPSLPSPTPPPSRIPRPSLIK